VSWKSTTTTKPCAFVPISNTSESRWTGRSRTADTLSHLKKADFTRRTLDTACWLWLGCCWRSNVANSYLSPGPFNSRVLRFCLVRQCSHPPHWPRHQRHLASCAWLPASYTSGQSSYPRRHPTCWASSQKSHTVSKHAVPWRLDICSTQRSPVHRVGMHGISNRDTHSWALEGGQGLRPPLNFENSTKKGCFLYFKWEKTISSLLLPP